MAVFGAAWFNQQVLLTLRACHSHMQCSSGQASLATTSRLSWCCKELPSTATCCRVRVRFGRFASQLPVPEPFPCRSGTPGLGVQVQIGAGAEFGANAAGSASRYWRLACPLRKVSLSFTVGQQEGCSRRLTRGKLVGSSLLPRRTVLAVSVARDRRRRGHVHRG